MILSFHLNIRNVFIWMKKENSQIVSDLWKVEIFGSILRNFLFELFVSLTKWIFRQSLLLGLKYCELSWEMAKPSDERNPDCLPCLFLQFPVRENGARVYKILQVFSKQVSLTKKSKFRIHEFQI